MMKSFSGWCRRTSHWQLAGANDTQGVMDCCNWSTLIRVVFQCRQTTTHCISQYLLTYMWMLTPGKYIYICACVYMCIYIYIYVCIYIYICIYVCIRVFMYIYVNLGSFWVWTWPVRGGVILALYWNVVFRGLGPYPEWSLKICEF